MTGLDSAAYTPPATALGRAVILATLTMATALYAMTVTIANVALPKMQGALSATQDQIAWVVTFNLVATAVATPMTGWLAARFGRRNLLLYGVFLFTATSLLCGLATSLPELVLYRIGQGLFGAPLVPLSQAIVLDTYPRRQHGGVMAIFGMGVVLGPIVAPTIGGYLTELQNWRWVFFMIVPCGLITLLGAWAFITDRRREKDTPLDWIGFLALSAAIALFQLMLDRGERQDWFESAEIIIAACLALVAFWIFVVHSLTAARPFLNPRLLLDRNFALGLMFTLAFGMLNFTPMTLFPALLQNLRGYPDTIIGLLLAARGVGTLAGFFIMMFASRFDPRYWLALGFIMQGIAGWYMAQFDINLTTWDVAWTSAVQGLGVGLIWVPLTVITFATLDPKYLPESTAVFHLLRNIGSSIFISISVAVVLRTANVNYATMTENVSPFNEALRFSWVTGAWTTDSPRSLMALGGEIERQALMIGYVNAFWLFAITAFVVTPFIFLLRLRRPEAGGD